MLDWRFSQDERNQLLDGHLPAIYAQNPQNSRHVVELQARMIKVRLDLEAFQVDTEELRQFIDTLSLS